MDSNRLPWIAIWTRILCDAVLIVGGALSALGALGYAHSSYIWFVPYGLMSAAVAVLTACSRKHRTRKWVTFLLLGVLLCVAAITLLAATRGGLSADVLIAIGYLAVWPVLSLLGLFLDRRVRSRIDHFASVERAEAAHRLRWKEPLLRLACGLVVLLYVPATLYYCVGFLAMLFTQVQSLSWSETPGTIVLSEMTEEPDSVFLGVYNLVYQYHINGKTYRGTRHNGLPPKLIEKWYADHLAEKYTMGSPVTVHYRPSNPSQSLLEPKLNAQVLLLLLGMALPLSIATSISYLAFDRELHFLLPAERYEPYATSVLSLTILGASLHGLFSAITASVFLWVTDLAPTHTEALAAWAVVLTTGWLHFRWVRRMVQRETVEKQAILGPKLCLGSQSL